MIWAVTALETNFRISVQVNANSLNNQGTANVSVYTGSACSGSALFNENNLTSSKTFLLTDAGTYSVRSVFRCFERMFFHADHLISEQ
ncbi:hypothetical protein [Leptospira tipperaryensis]|nr:hypothetical protein [Leptospira tipperaryensis]